MQLLKHGFINNLLASFITIIFTNLLYASYSYAALSPRITIYSNQPKRHYIYLRDRTPEEIADENIARFFQYSPLQLQFCISLELETKGYLSPGFTISGHNAHHMGWIEIISDRLVDPKGPAWRLPVLAQLHDDYLRNPALCKNTLQRESAGMGFGGKINALHTLKVYVYQRLHTGSHQGSLPEADRDLHYKTLIGGLEIASLGYRISLNTRRGTLEAVEMDPSQASDSDLITKDVLPVKRYYFDLFRDKLDLIDNKHWGVSTQIQLDPFKRIAPYLGVYYDYVDFIAPKACFRKHASLEIPCDYFFSKHVVGLNMGLQWQAFRYMQITLTGSIDNAHGWNAKSWQAGATFKIYAPLQTVHYHRETLLKYHRSPMYHIGPNHYTRTMALTDWKQPNDSNAAWNIPTLRGQHLTTTTTMVTAEEAPLKIHGIRPLQNTLFTAAQYHYKNPDSLPYLRNLPPEFLKHYLKRLNYYPDKRFANHFYPSQTQLSDLGSNSYRDLSRSCDELTRFLFYHPFESDAVIKEPRFYKLTKKVTPEQLQGIQFLMNTTHLFHNLTPGQSYGVICLAKSKLGLKYPYQYLLEKIESASYSRKSLPPKIQALGNSCNAILAKAKTLGYIGEMFPMEINSQIISYILLDESHIQKTLDERYQHQNNESEEARKEINSIQRMMVESIINSLTSKALS